MKEELLKLAELKLQYAKEELSECDIKWSDHFLNTKDFSPEFDFGTEEYQINFNLYLGGYIALMEAYESL
jgi:hypothetical protein